MGVRDSKGRAAVIFNPIAGAGRGSQVASAAVDKLKAGGWSAQTIATGGRGGARESAQELAEGVDLLVVAGGDGSLREAIEGLGDLRSRVLVGFLPIGNANVVAQELGIPLRAEAAVEVLVSGVPTTMDLGSVRFAGENQGHCFLAVVGLGWDAQTVENLDRLRHSPLGRWWYRVWADSAYFGSGMLALTRAGAPRFRLRVDGGWREADYCGLHLSNLRTYAKGMAVTPDAHHRSGRIHYQARKRSAVHAVALHFAAAALRRRVPSWLSDYGDGCEFIVESDEPIPVQVDGDFKGSWSGLELTVLPNAVRILAPRQPALPPLDPHQT